jgi:8-oxo-dGTP diphosphatase
MRSAYGAKETGIGEHEIGNGEHPVTIVVDVANVMGSRPDGWWRDRAGAAVRLHAELVGLAASGRGVPPGETDPPDFVMVLEGAAKAAAGRLSAASPAGSPPGAATPGAATPGAATPGAATTGAATTGAATTGAATTGAATTRAARAGEVRVVLAPGSGDDAIVAVVRELPGHRVVVTADRELRERCVAAGATILGPGWLLALLRP